MRDLKAVIFGAIGVIAETSDLQRQAFNIAFREAGLDWTWDNKTYRDLLRVNGGQARIRAFREANSGPSAVTDEMIASLHTAKTRAYAALLKASDLHPRPGVANVIKDCIQSGVRVAFCTSTSRANLDSLREALGNRLPFEQFSTVVTLDKIAQPKPAPDAYLYCLAQLGLQPDQAVAIEDTPASIAAAKAAGIVTIATPGATTADQDFSAADWVVPDLFQISVEHLKTLEPKTAAQRSQQETIGAFT